MRLPKPELLLVVVEEEEEEAVVMGSPLQELLLLEAELPWKGKPPRCCRHQRNL